MTSWKDSYVTGSFRGAQFHVRSADGSGDPLTVHHKFPTKTQHYLEQMGTDDYGFSFQAYCVGDDYQTQRDALITACRTTGAGELQHPYMGVWSVKCTGLRWREAIQDGGLCTFDLAFVVDSGKVYPEAVADTAAAAGSATANARTTVLSAFAGAFAIAGAAGKIVDAAAGVVGLAATAIAEANTIVSGGLLASGLTDAAALLGRDAGGWDRGQAAAAQAQALAGLDALVTAAAVADASDADALAQALAGSVALATNLAGSPAAAWTAQTALAAWTLPAPASAAGTMGQAIAANQAAVVELVRLTAVTEAARIATSYDYDSADQALLMRDQLTDLIDDAIADTRSDAVYRSLTDLRRAAAAEIMRRGAHLGRIITVTPAQTEPALVTAWRLHGAIAGADDITRRNGLRHPGFVPGGMPLNALATVAS